MAQRFTPGALRILCQEYTEEAEHHTSFTAFLRRKGYNRASVYRALEREGIEVPTVRPKWDVHLQLQRREACPPEVYCARNGLSLRSFRRWARGKQIPLRCRTPRAKRIWWQKALAEMPLEGHRMWCYARTLPVGLVADAYHRHIDGEFPRLWGFNDVYHLPQSIVINGTDREPTNPTHFITRPGQPLLGISLPAAQRLHKDLTT